MKYQITAAVLSFALVPSTWATWCEYFYDSGCTSSSNGNTNFDCANSGVFGSGGSYVLCHETTGNCDIAVINRCADSACSDVLNTFSVDPQDGPYGYGISSCTYAGGAGPYYQESCQPNPNGGPC